MKNFVDLANRLFEAREQSHVYHLQTKSQAEHLAFEEFYDELLEHLDLLIEVYQGQFGIIDNYETIKPKKYMPNHVEYFEDLAKFLKENISDYISENDPHLLAIIDDILILTYKTIYKLKYLK